MTGQFRHIERDILNAVVTFRAEGHWQLDLTPRLCRAWIHTQERPRWGQLILSNLQLVHQLSREDFEDIPSIHQQFGDSDVLDDGREQHKHSAFPGNVVWVTPLIEGDGHIGPLKWPQYAQVRLGGAHLTGESLELPMRGH